MKIDYRYNASEDLPAVDAKFAAQRISFGPMVFHAAKTMIDLGILNLVYNQRKNGITAKQISKELDLPLHGVTVLLEVGLSSNIVGLKPQSEAECYVLTKTGFFLLNDELTKINMNFVSDVCYQGMSELTVAIKDQIPAGLKGFGDWATIYEGLSQLPEQVKKSWFEFDHFYSDTAFGDVLPHVFKEKPKKIIDVGGNTGKWALKCLEYDPLVKMTLVDLPGQLNVAQEKIAQKGFSKRVEYISLNLLEESGQLPTDGDVIWMSQFLDCFSPKQIVTLVSNAQKAMRPGSRLFVLETFWDCQQFEASAYSLHNTSLYFICLANGNSKMYRSDEMIDLLEQAGLQVVKQTDNIGIAHTLLECRKK